MNKKSFIFNFIAFYAVMYMGNAVYSTFIPVYLNNIGFNSTSIGTLLAVGPMVAVIAQPVWGLVTDRSTFKNNVLKLIIIGSGISVVFYRISNSFYYLIFIITVFTFFQASIFPLSDTVTLEYIDKTEWKFGNIRLAGTIGHAIMSVVAGYMARKNINIIFPLYFILSIAAYMSVSGLPKVKGHQSKGNKISIAKLWHVKGLVVLMLFNAAFVATLNFYYSFFPIFYQEIGGSSSLLGWAMLISSMSEVPFLLTADRIINKLGIKATLTFSTLILSIRWMLMYFVHNKYIVLVISALLGFNYIVFAYCLAIYINKKVPKELKASGQTINNLVGALFGRIVGSIFGGYLSDIFGIREVFLFSSIFAFVTCIIWIFATNIMDIDIKSKDLGAEYSAES
jgi:PPP family 3-phenylpropionic acid transporter